MKKSERIKRYFKWLCIAAAGGIVSDQAILHLYMNPNFGVDNRDPEVKVYPIRDTSMSLSGNIVGEGVYNGPLFNLRGKTIGGVKGFGDADTPLLTHEECIKQGSNFNLDSVTYIMGIDTITGDVKCFPSYDINKGNMAERFWADEKQYRNRIVLQNGNYLMIKGGVPQKANGKRYNKHETVRVAFGTDGGGNYVFVKFYGTIYGFQQYLKEEFGRGNPKCKPGSKYEKAAFMYLDGNNIVFDGKYCITHYNKLKNNSGWMKFAKLQILKRANHLNAHKKHR